MTGIAPKETLLYQLIVSPSYRLLRHAILVVAVGAISLSQTTYSFAGKAGLLGGRVYLMALVTFIAYLAIGYMHMYLLVPRLLLRKKYLDYLFFSSLSVALLVSIKPWQEYGIHEYFGTPHLRSNYFGAVSLLDMLSDFVLVMLCITDISMSVLLKTWLEESRRKNELEKIRLQTEVDAMKEQVNPELLFQTLHQTARLAATHPERAGATVLQLSQFLRYGLYDGSRDRVLLSAEIDFLKNYLRLEQFTDDYFEFGITASPATFRTFVTPSIFTPILQKVLTRMPHATPKPRLEVSFDELDGALLLRVRYDGTDTGIAGALVAVTHRIEQLYGKQVQIEIQETVSARKSIVIQLAVRES